MEWIGMVIAAYQDCVQIVFIIFTSSRLGCCSFLSVLLKNKFYMPDHSVMSSVIRLILFGTVQSD